jgi:hypothetical protein
MDQRIHELLSQISSEKDPCVYSYDDKDLNLLEMYDLIEKQGDFIYLNRFSLEVLKMGGWLNYRINQEQLNQLEIENLKAPINANHLSKWSLAISIAALIIAILALIIKL